MSTLVAGFWLTVARKFSVHMLFLASLIVLACFWFEPRIVAALIGGKVGGDFTNLWTAARLVLAGELSSLHDFSAYRAVQVALFGPDFPPHWWSYPPHFLLLIWPLGALSYELALAVWLGVTLVVYLAAVRCWLGRPSAWRLFLLAIAPASVINIIAGQTGFLTASLIIAGLWWLERRPILAGLAFALLTVKPQLGLLIPLVVLAGGHWRVLASAVIGFTILFAASVLVFGWQIWSDYLAFGADRQMWFLTSRDGKFTFMMPTPFMASRLLGLSSDIAFGIQAVCSIGLAALTFVFAQRTAGDNRWIGLFVMLSVVLVSPYAFNYDMTVVSLAVLLALTLSTEPRTKAVERFLWIVLWMLPVLVLFLNLVRAPLAPLLIGAGLWYLWRQFNVSVLPVAGRIENKPERFTSEPSPTV